MTASESLSILKVGKEQNSPPSNLFLFLEKNKQKVKLLVDKFQMELTVVLSAYELILLRMLAFISALEYI